MKIGSSVDITSTDAAARSSRAGAASTAPLSASAAVDQVDVSAAASQLNKLGGQDFDSGKVEAIRTAIREGRFTVNAGAIADQLIADATALLGPRTA